MWLFLAIFIGALFGFILTGYVRVVVKKRRKEVLAKFAKKYRKGSPSFGKKQCHTAEYNIFSYDV